MCHGKRKFKMSQSAYLIAIMMLNNKRRMNVLFQGLNKKEVGIIPLSDLFEIMNMICSCVNEIINYLNNEIMNNERAERRDGKEKL